MAGSTDLILQSRPDTGKLGLGSLFRPGSYPGAPRPRALYAAPWLATVDGTVRGVPKLKAATRRAAFQRISDAVPLIQITIEPAIAE
jgi:hypothetical protein